MGSLINMGRLVDVGTLVDVGCLVDVGSLLVKFGLGVGEDLAGGFELGELVVELLLVGFEVFDQFF
jgi:hypothetical protein